MSFTNPTALEKFAEKLVCFHAAQMYYKRHIKFIALNGDENVLDFGCGGGSCSKLLLKQLNSDSKMTLLDTSKYWVDVAKRRFKNKSNITYYTEEIHNLNLKNESFDFINLTYVLHDIASNKHQKIVECFYKALKPNGKVGLWEPTKPHHGMQPEEIQRLFEKAGFTLEKHQIYRSSYDGLFVKRK